MMIMLLISLICALLASVSDANYFTSKLAPAQLINIDAISLKRGESTVAEYSNVSDYQSLKFMKVVRGDQLMLRFSCRTRNDIFLYYDLMKAKSIFSDAKIISSTKHICGRFGTGGQLQFNTSTVEKFGDSFYFWLRYDSPLGTADLFHSGDFSISKDSSLNKYIKRWFHPSTSDTYVNDADLKLQFTLEKPIAHDHRVIVRLIDGLKWSSERRWFLTAEQVNTPNKDDIVTLTLPLIDHVKPPVKPSDNYRIFLYTEKTFGPGLWNKVKDTFSFSKEIFSSSSFQISDFSTQPVVSAATVAPDALSGKASFVSTNADLASNFNSLPVGSVDAKAAAGSLQPEAQASKGPPQEGNVASTGAPGEVNDVSTGAPQDANNNDQAATLGDLGKRVQSGSWD